MKKSLIFALLLRGFTFIVSQILLIRELLIIFHGNELSIGIILGNWFVLEALGSFIIGRTADRIRKKIELFTILQSLVSIFLPTCIYLTRIIRDITGIPSGEGLGIIPIFCFSFFILAPLSLSNGAQFSLGCKIYHSSTKKTLSSIGMVYIYEALGATIGGIISTYILIPHFHSIKIALIISALNLFSAILLLTLSGEKLTADLKPKKKISRYVLSIPVLLFGLTTYLIFSQEADKIQMSSLYKQWKGNKLLHYQNSIYGNVAVTQREEQYNFFSDGIPLFSVPVPDTTFVEELAHIPMLFHPDPKKILLISGGVGGVLNEILKHPVENIDYAEIDPLMIKLTKEFTTALTNRELNNPNVNIKYVDGRFFIKTTQNRYDVIMINLPPPSTLQLNRFYTREFFQMTNKILLPNGILVVRLPGSSTYLNEELRKLNNSIYSTIQKVYPYIYVIPGDFNLFLASQTHVETSTLSQTLIQRLEKRKLKTKLLTDFHIAYKLDKERLNWFFNSIKDSGKIKINGDLLPSGLFYTLSFWNDIFSPKLKFIFRLTEKVNLPVLLIPLILFTLISFIKVKFSTNKSTKILIPFVIATTGFTGIAFSLIIIFAFQCFYGYVYYRISLLITAFMVGLSLGSFFMVKSLVRIKNFIAYLVKIESIMVIFSISVPIIILYLHSTIITGGTISSYLQIIFLLLSVISGILVGVEFPLANEICLKNDRLLSKTAGSIYAADLLGSCIGALLVSVMLIPVLGITKTCILIIALKLSSTFLVSTLRISDKNNN